MYRFWGVIVVLILGVGIFGGESPVHGAPRPLKIVVTNSILNDLVRNIANEDVSLTVLVGANGDPHTYEPSPKDSVHIRKADIIFENGLSLEPWLDDLYRSSGSQAGRVRVTDGIDLIRGGQNDHENHSEDFDPHVWHDVQNVRIMVGVIRDSLVKADPDHAEEYRKNAEIYDQELARLDQWVKDKTAGLPLQKKKLVTSHDTFGYFARRYGFEVIGTVINSATTEAADPSASQMAKLVTEMRSAGVPAIFVENVANPQTVKTIAREAKVKVAPGLYSDALGAADSEADTYVKMMKYNVTTIVEALQDE